MQSSRQLTSARKSRKVGSDGRDIPALFASVHKVHPRASTGSIRWCASNSATYVVLKVVTGLAQSVVLDTLAEVFEIVQQQLEAHGDGVIPARTFDRFPSDEGMLVSIMNANNHQVTWGVLQAAIEALGDFMEQYGYGSVIFQIYDGPNQVGRGSILPE